MFPAASRVDALHVALASVARADALVSWNFQHLVQLRRIRGFHAVNVLAETLHRLAAQAPLWRSVAKPHAELPPRAVRARRKRQSTG